MTGVEIQGIKLSPSEEQAISDAARVLALNGALVPAHAPEPPLSHACSTYEQGLKLLYLTFVLKGLPDELKMQLDVASLPNLESLISPKDPSANDTSAKDTDDLAKHLSQAEQILGELYAQACANQDRLISLYHPGSKKEPLIVWIDGLTSPGTWPLWTLFNVKRQVDAYSKSCLGQDERSEGVGVLVLKYPYHKADTEPSILGGSTAHKRRQDAASQIREALGTKSANSRQLILIGHSAGAQLALELAHEFKDQAKLVIPINVPYTFINGAVHLALALAGTAVRLVPGSQKLFNRFNKYFGPSQYGEDEPYSIVPSSHWNTRVFKYISLGLFASITAVRLAIFNTVRGFSAPVNFINSDRDEMFTFLRLKNDIFRFFSSSGGRFSFDTIASPHSPTIHYKESERLAEMLAQRVVSLLAERKESKLGRFLRGFNNLLDGVIGMLGNRKRHRDTL